MFLQIALWLFGRKEGLLVRLVDSADAQKKRVPDAEPFWKIFNSAGVGPLQTNGITIPTLVLGNP